MESKGETANVSFSIIYRGEHDEYGEILVCVRGIHSLDDPTFMPLDHELVVVRRNDSNDAWIPLEDLAAGQEAVRLATAFWYMMRGTVVTSDAQPQREGTNEKLIWRLDIPEYGVTIVEPCGLVLYDDDYYYILVAHPGPKVYLTVILEVVSSKPLEWISIRLDKDRVNAIIEVYLRTIGAIEVESEEEPNGGNMLEDDTVVPGQYWTTPKGIGES